MIVVAAMDLAQLYVALRFLSGLRRRWRRQPEVRIGLAVTSEAARRIAEREAGPEDRIIDFPPDLDADSPTGLLVIGNALPFDLIRLAAARGIPVSWIGGEINRGDFATWAQSPAFRGLRDAFSMICLRTEKQRERLLALGFPGERIHAVGCVKYDSAEPQEGAGPRAADLLRAAGMAERRPVLLGGSVWKGEDTVLLDLCSRLRSRFPGLCLVLAPVLMQDASHIESEALRLGLRLVRRSRLPAEPAADVLLLDSVGDLRDLYSQADVVFLGRSLTHRPGANLAEPAAQSRAVVVGPHMEHFAEILADFQAADAVVQVSDAAGLGFAVERLFASPEIRANLGRRAREVVIRNSGALEWTLDLFSPACEPSTVWERSRSRPES